MAWVSPASVNGSVRATPGWVEAAITVLVVPKSRPSAMAAEDDDEEEGLGMKANTPPFVDAWRDELAMCGLAGGLRILRHRLSSPTDAKRCIDISIGPTLAA